MRKGSLSGAAFARRFSFQMAGVFATSFSWWSANFKDFSSAGCRRASFVPAFAICPRISPYGAAEGLCSARRSELRTESGFLLSCQAESQLSLAQQDRGRGSADETIPTGLLLIDAAAEGRPKG